MSDVNPNPFVLQALFGAQNNVLNGVLRRVGQIDQGSVGSITVEDARRFIENHDANDQLGQAYFSIQI